jgi:hypothetical protein
VECTQIERKESNNAKTGIKASGMKISVGGGGDSKVPNRAREIRKW